MREFTKEDPPRLIACDLDGTLLNGKAELTEKNRRAIISMAEKGVLFVPTTGRALYEIAANVRELDFIRYFITSNGANIYDRETGRSIETLINAEDLPKILNVMREYQVYPTIHYGGISFVDENLTTPECMDYFNISDYYKDHLKKTNSKMPYFNEFFGEKRAVEMVCGFFKHRHELEECAQRLSKIKSIFVTGSTSSSIEILSVNATKGNAVTAFAKDLGIDICNVVAVGDSHNDLTMIQRAGLGLATANASDLVKSNADRVICSNEENVAEYLFKELF